MLVIVTPSQWSKGKVWTASHKGVHLLTNPIFYKLKWVGGPKADARVAANQLQNVKASYAVINKWLIAMDVGGTASTTDAKRARKMARDRMKRSSTKTWGSGPLLHMACTSPTRFNYFLCKIIQRNYCTKKLLLSQGCQLWGVADIPPEHNFSCIIFDFTNSTITHAN